MAARVLEAAECRETWTIEPGDHVPRTKVLQREAKRVKLDGAVVISCKLADRKKILNNGRCNKNIIKIKGAR